MKKALLWAPALLAAALLSWNLTSSAPLQTAGAPPTPLRSFRIVFGARQERPRDYSARLALSAGKLVDLRPWRFFGQDSAASDAWKLSLKRTVFETQPDQAVPLATMGRPDNIVPAGVDITVEAPPSATAAVQAPDLRLTIPMADLDYRRILEYERGDVTVQPTPAVRRVSEIKDEEQDHPSMTVTKKGVLWLAWQSYKDSGDHVYARHSTAAGWSEVFRLTGRKADIYRTGIAEDGSGRIWVVWSERAGRQWHLNARSFDGRSWSSARALTTGEGPNFSHRLIGSPAGDLHLVWIGHRQGQSHVFWSRLKDGEWSAPASISSPSAWAPDAAADSQGNLYVAWDGYREGNYDIFLRRIAAGGTLGPEEQVTRSAAFQAHASLAVDRQDRLWLAWDESGANWGKDWSHEDPWRSTVLYRDRRPQVALRDNGVWKQPEGDLMAAVPARYNRYVELPRLACDSNGRVWLALQIRTSAGMSRADYWAAGGRWEHFLTTLEGGHWTPLMPVPQSSSRPEGPFHLHPDAGGVRMAWTNDNRPFGPSAGLFNSIPSRHEIFTGSFQTQGAPPALRLIEFQEQTLRPQLVHPNEADDVRRIREYRTSVAGSQYRILRGDFHRHTEISSDGSGDGSLDDYFRYMIDAAAMDTGIIGDHNAGNDNEYTWWRTEKAIDLYLISGRFTPLFGYERSVPYPNGHRNVVFAQRGVRTLPIGREEAKGEINTGKVLYPYLRQHRGIAMLHSLATGQGSDFRDNDPELEPLVELYQGYHASYEYEGAPLAETDRFMVSIHGGYRPAGFWWNALAKGLKLGVQASSDHIATHNSYAMIYTPEAERSAIVESMRARRAYAATDNIVLDFRALDGQGREHFMGEAFRSSSAPKLVVRVLGTAPIERVEIVKDGRFVFRAEPDSPRAEFTYVDQEPGARESHYYVRVMQTDRNLAWSSPVWVDYRR